MSNSKTYTTSTIININNTTTTITADTTNTTTAGSCSVSAPGQLSLAPAANRCWDLFYHYIYY